jgi:protein-disulfide isomerase
MVGMGALMVGLGAWVAYEEQRSLEESLYANDYGYGGTGTGYDAYDTYANDTYGNGYGNTDPFAQIPTADTYGAAPAVSDVYAVPVDGSPVLGPDDALVTVVVFSDFQCPFCSRATATLEQIRATYGTDVRVVFKNNPLPFHTDAMPAAELAMEAFEQRGSAGFFEAHDLLFENQRALSRADLEGYAARLGLSLSETRRALDNHEHRDAIQRDMDLASRLGANGTPTFFINGRQIAGAQPYETFAATIDQERASAQVAVALGVPRSQIYPNIQASATR